MRSYIVIPAGTPILRVSASTPHFAASKARNGKAEHFDGDRPMVVPASSVIDGNGRSEPLPGQLMLTEAR